LADYQNSSLESWFCGERCDFLYALVALHLAMLCTPVHAGRKRCLAMVRLGTVKCMLSRGLAIDSRSSQISRRPATKLGLAIWPSPDTTYFLAASFVRAKYSIQSGLAPVRAGGRNAALRKRIADGVDRQVSQDRHCFALKRSIMTGNSGRNRESKIERTRQLSAGPKYSLPSAGVVCPKAADCGYYLRRAS
jgi:hypothetical protein